MGSWPAARAVSKTVALSPGMNSVTVTIPSSDTKAVRLWHPHGHGAQPLYNVTATVAVPAAKHPDPVATRRIGFRHAALVTINDTDAATVAAAKAQTGNGDFTMMFRVRAP